MKKLPRCFFLCLTGFLWMQLAGQAWAQVKEFNFRQISLEDGLSQSSVFAIAQDDDGFMWFGTQDGLNKFDGYQFTTYKKRPFDSTSLADSQIEDLLKDKEGNLWIGTAHGLNLLQKHTHQFLNLSRLLHKDNEPEALMINCLYEDSRGYIWIGTNLGLVRLIAESNQKASSPQYRVGRWVFEEKNNHSLSNNSVTSILEDQQGHLWIGTRNGINRIDKAQANNPATLELSFRNHRNINQPVYQLEARFVSSMVQDRFGSVWAGTGRGLYRIDVSTGQTPEHYTQDSTQSLFLSHNQVFSLLLDSQGAMWVGTYGGGMNKVHFSDNGKVHAIHKLKQSVASLEGYRKDYVLSMYENKEKHDGTLWFGLEGGGVAQFNPSKNNFKLYQRDPLSHNTLSESTVFSILKDYQGFLWVGTSNGLNRLDPVTQQWTQYRSRSDDEKTLFHSHIASIYEDKDRTLWIGTMGGISRYNRKTQTFERVIVQVEDREVPWLGLISAMCEDQEGNLWIGASYDLIKINKKTLQGKSYGYQEKKGSRLTGGRITTIYADRQGTLWIGTYAGLNRYNRATDDFSHFSSQLHNPNSLSDNAVFSMLQDRNGTYWIATGLGLNKLTFQQGKPHFEHYMEKDGLPNNFVYAVLEDEIGRIWLSTNSGLSAFTPSLHLFVNYGVADGLQSKEFNSGAYFRAANGEMFFGGIKGFNSFFPDNMRVNQHVPKIKITALRKFESPLNLDSLLLQPNGVELDYNENFFSFEFVALDYANPSKNQYAYQLEGFDKDWIYCGNRRYASFTNMDPGEYVFKVKGSNDNGVWNSEAIASIRIRINPPFWMTWWFYLLSLAVVLLMAKIIHDVRVRTKLRRLLELEKVRMMESERVRKQTASDFHDEMGNRITRIGVLTELIKVQLDGYQKSEIGDLLSKISDNCNTLYNGTRDFIWSINPDNNSFFEVAVRLKDFGDDLFDNTAIHFQVGEIAEELKDMKLPMDWSRQLILIFKEAITNSLKHAQCQHVYLQFRIIDEEAFISLTDDGQGFEFGRSKGGTGLNNMTNRAKKINSQLLVTSAKDHGTKIIFSGQLPQNGGVLV